VNLESYDSVKNNLARIAVAVLVDGTMPKSGDLAKEDKDLLSAWIKAGAPEHGGGDHPEEPLKPTYNSIKKKIFEVKCMSCHSTSGAGHDVHLEPWKDLLNSPRDLVLPGNSEESGLIIAVSRTDAKRMPPPNSGGTALSNDEIAVVKKWIDSGALDGDGVSPSPSPSPSIPGPNPSPSNASTVPAPTPSVLPRPSPSST
jgi:uncharacterized membrane protein